MNLVFPKLRLEHRLLVNFRVPSPALEELLPAPLRPREVKGYGLISVCLRRHAMPLPPAAGRWISTSAEVAVHRIAVEWEREGQVRPGLLVLQTDVSSIPGLLVASHLFPGPLHRARFESETYEGEVQTQFLQPAGSVQFSFRGASSAGIPRDSVFTAPQEAYGFFKREELALCARKGAGNFGRRQVRHGDHVFEPLHVHDVRCSLFETWAESHGITLELDSAFLARRLMHAWQRQEERSVYRVPAAASFYRST
jgi:hypothetical protein